MTVTVSPADPRSVRALAVLATADRWERGLHPIQRQDMLDLALTAIERAATEG